MTLREVTVEVATEKRDFPVGTVSTKFKFELFNSTGTLLSTIDTDAFGAVFPGIPDGATYVAKVTANGVSVNKTFSIAASAVSLDVPVAVTVTF